MTATPPPARLWDISQPLRPGLPVWPGDTAFGEERTWSIQPGCPVNVSRLVMSTHSGTHADAPLHYDATGLTAGALDLTPYLGPAQVITVPPGAPFATVDHVAPQWLPGMPRLLLHSYDRFPHEAWRSDYTAIDPALIDWLARQGGVLLGTDAPSLDPQDSKDLPAHTMLNRHRLAVLEGLVLDAVPDGIYELIALPLPLSNADASPVRAVLREWPYNRLR
ncbi:arylformamidase [Nitrospirillum sp. BR 11752]|uniref:arylformamidase n=1 Tax=Nitrospirillum sp. BR 11752 TaxID=3104293 RepID=UPI002EC8A31C|nr:arylformamidase [Nitrospirillum sp. BR 11752]